MLPLTKKCTTNYHSSNWLISVLPFSSQPFISFMTDSKSCRSIWKQRKLLIIQLCWRGAVLAIRSCKNMSGAPHSSKFYSQQRTLWIVTMALWSPGWAMSLEWRGKTSIFAAEKRMVTLKFLSATSLKTWWGTETKLNQHHKLRTKVSCIHRIGGKSLIGERIHSWVNNPQNSSD